MDLDPGTLWWVQPPRLGAWDGRVDLLRYLQFATSTVFLPHIMTQYRESIERCTSMYVYASTCISLPLSLSLFLSLSLSYSCITQTHTYTYVTVWYVYMYIYIYYTHTFVYITHIHIYEYIYIYMCISYHIYIYMKICVQDSGFRCRRSPMRTVHLIGGAFQCSTCSFPPQTVTQLGPKPWASPEAPSGDYWW